MANLLVDAIEQGIKAEKNLVWLDAEAYGTVVIRDGKPFPWTDPTEFVASYCQLQRWLQPSVVPVHVGRFFNAWLDENGAVRDEMSGKTRARFAIKRFLGLAGPRLVIRAIVGALCDAVSQPVVLVLPTNGTLINWANQAANGTGPVELSDIDIDSVSVYLADFLRTFAGLEVAGVLLQLPTGSKVDPQTLELYSPIINLAKDYHWSFAVQVADPVEVSDPEKKIDLVLSNHGCARGRFIPKNFWTDGEFDRDHQGVWFAAPHPDLAPELVLERLAQLRGDTGSMVKEQVSSKGLSLARAEPDSPG